MRLSLRTSSVGILPLLIVLVLTMLIYLPGLYGDFEFDDSVNILSNDAIKVVTLSRESILAAATSGKSGPLGRSVSMLSFAGNYYLTEFDPLFFKLTNVIIHIFAGLGVYAFTRQLSLALDKGADTQKTRTRANIIAMTAASIWLVHPLNLTSVLYVVQRMTSLAALFTFLALALYVLGRRKILENQYSSGLLFIMAALGPLTALAVLSKENGALTPYLILCVELIVFRFASAQKGTRFFLYVVFTAMVLIPLILAVLNHERLATFVASGYLKREFSLADRLLTQPQVLMFYLRLMFLPNTGMMGIFHDDFPISTSFFQSFWTVVSVGAICALGLVGALAVRRAPALAIGILWFFVGHSMESSFLALEMVHEHRNYLPIVGPIFAASYYFWHVDFKALSVRAKLCFVILIVAVFSAVTYVRSLQWSNLVEHSAIEVHNHPNSDRANYQMGRMYFMLYNNEPNEELAKLAETYFSRAAALGSNSIFPVTAMIQMAYKARYDPAPAWVEMAVKRLQYGRPWEPNMVALNNLVNCQMREYCRLADTDITRLLQAALANPGASPRMLGTAHSLLGGYYAVKLENLAFGIPHIKAAVDADPERIEYRLDLVRLYEVAGDFGSAKAELDAARKLDKWSLLKERLDAEDASLDKALKARAN